MFPVVHGRWWNRERTLSKPRSEAIAEMQTTLPQGADLADEILAHAQEIAQTARDRADAADRRATTIAGTVAIAASLTLSGASLIFDDGKIRDETWQAVLAFLLFAATAAFVTSAIYALVALVRHRRWNWSDTRDLPRQIDSADALKRRRAAFLLHNWEGNWEISDVKNRLVDNALRTLIAALVLLVALSLALFAYALFG